MWCSYGCINVVLPWLRSCDVTMVTFMHSSHGFIDAVFTWDTHRRHPAVRVSNDGYTASVGESARWISIGGSQILESGRHYWELSLDRYGITSPTKKIVAGIVSAKLDPSRWQRGRSVIGLYSSPFNVPSWSLAVQTGKKLSHNTSSR